MNMRLDESFGEIVDLIPLKDKTKKSKETASRNRTIFLRYTGLHGKGVETLEGIGKSYNLTRECIRQIIVRLDKKISIDGDLEKEIKALFNLIDFNSPIESKYLSEIAHEKKLIKNPDFDLINPALYFSKKMGIDLGCETEKVNNSLFLIPNNFQVKPNQVISEASKVVNRYGVCSIESLAIRFGFKYNEMKSYIQSCVEATETCIWIDDEKNHFYIEKDRVSRMDRRLSQIFSVYKTVSLDKLYQALARSLRQGTDNCEESPEYKIFVGKEKIKGHQDEKNRRMVIDEDLLKSYLISKGYKVSRHNIVSGNAAQINDNEPLPLEINVINILQKQPKGQLREIEIENELSIKPKSREHFSFVTTTYYSSLMIRSDRGVLELLGSLK